MGCNMCSSPERLIPPPDVQPTIGSPTKIAQLEAYLTLRRTEKNRGGFPKFSQLSLVTSSPPASPVRPRSPQKKTVKSMVSDYLSNPRTL